MANLVSLLRCALIPLIIYFLFKRQPIPAALLILIAAISDILDGYIARHFNQITTLGKILDPAADKLMSASILISLLILNKVPLWFFIVVLGKDFLIVISSFFIFKKKKINTVSNTIGKITFAAIIISFIAAIFINKISLYIYIITTIIICVSLISYWRVYMTQIIHVSE